MRHPDTHGYGLNGKLIATPPIIRGFRGDPAIAAPAGARSSTRGFGGRTDREPLRRDSAHHKSTRLVPASSISLQAVRQGRRNQECPCEWQPRVLVNQAKSALPVFPECAICSTKGKTRKPDRTVLSSQFGNRMRCTRHQKTYQTNKKICTSFKQEPIGSTAIMLIMLPIYG